MSTRKLQSGGLATALVIVYPASWVALVSGFIAHFFPNAGPPLWYVFIACLLGGLVSVWFGLIGRLERFGILSRLREYILMLFLVWTTSSLFGWEDAASLITPRVVNVWACIVFTVFWAIQLDFQVLIVEQAVYHSFVRGRQGEVLALFLRQNDGLQEPLRALVAATTSMAIVLSLILAPLFLVSALLDEGFSPLLLVLMAAHLFFAALTFTLLARWRQECDLNVEGLKAGRSADISRLGFVALFAVLALGGAILLARDTSLVPEAWVSRFLAWLASPPKNARPVTPDTAALATDISPPPDFSEILRQSRKGPSFDPSIIWTMLSRAVPVAALFALVFFVVRPLSLRGLRALFARYPPGQAFESLRRAIRALFSRRKRRRRRPKPEVDDLALESIRGFLSQLDQRRHSLPKRRQLGRMTEDFLSIVAWGMARGTPWRESTGPHEFCSALASNIPAQNAALKADILRAGLLFERAVYGQDLLDKRTWNEYHKCVERITSSHEKYQGLQQRDPGR